MYKYDTAAFPDPMAFVMVPLPSLYGFAIDTKGKVWVARGFTAPGFLYKIDADTAVLEASYPVPPEVRTGVAADVYGNILLAGYSGNEALRFECSILARMGTRPPAPPIHANQPRFRRSGQDKALQ